MGTEKHPSFTPYRKWGIGLNVALVLLVVFGIVVMANYLARDYFFRFHLSGLTRNQLSPRTISLLHSITNDVKVTLYYDRNEPLYSTVADLLNEYRLTNPRVSVRTVDYLRDAGLAQQVRSNYHLAPPADKNLVIFDCGGKSRIVEGNTLAQYTLEQVPGEKEREYRRKPTAFMGETMFTAALLHVTQPEPLIACFVQGHGEHLVDNTPTGYLKFAELLAQNYVEPRLISIIGTNEVPTNCDLLIIAGPRAPYTSGELDKVDAYLQQGKRLLVLLNADSVGRETGLETLLAHWGVHVGGDALVDPEHSSSGSDVIISAFSKHEMVNPLLGSGLYMILPRMVARIQADRPQADAPRVEEVAYTGGQARPASNPSAKPQRYPVMAALEKAPPRGVVTEHGAARMVVAGDSSFLCNNQLEMLGNRDFAASLVNWLLERTHMMAGVGPRPVTEFRLVLSSSQVRTARWVLLAGLPGAVLLIGALVYWRRNT